MENKTLKESAPLMLSENYKDRFKAEYMQLNYRFNGLNKMLKDWDAGTLTFKPTCPKELYTYQLQSMKIYLDMLTIRATLEDIAL